MKLYVWKLDLVKKMENKHNSNEKRKKANRVKCSACCYQLKKFCWGTNWFTNRSN